MTKIIRLCVGMLALAVGGFGQSLTVSPNPVILSGGATDAYVTVTWSQGNSGLSCVEVINDSGAVLATGHGGSFSVSISAVTTFTLRTCSGGTDITSVHVNVVVPAISANPSTAVAAPGAAYGATTIYWNAPGTSNVDIRLGSTTGKLFASGGTSGSAPTPTFVTNGMDFVLVVQGTSTYLSSVSVPVQFVPNVNIDAPASTTPYRGGVATAGWAIDSQTTIAAVNVAVDGVSYGAATLNGARPVSVPRRFTPDTRVVPTWDGITLWTRQNWPPARTRSPRQP